MSARIATKASCPYCHRKMTAAVWKAKRQIKIDNAHAMHAKLKESGKWPGGRPKVRNDAEIKRLRSKGLSIRSIAKEIGMSTTAVQDGLKS